MKAILKYILIKYKPFFEFIFETEAYIATHWASNVHKRLMMVQWLPPQPEHFDHHIDLFYDWIENRNSFWLERGVFGSLALLGGNLLELGCGDGFNARNFYSLRSKKVTACDFDPKAIRTAKKKNSAENIEYVLSDIRYNMPEGKFENLVWDASIEHFTPEEIEQILNNIKSRLTKNGVFSGYTIVERSDGIKSLSHHEYEFQDKNDLLLFLAPHFKNVTVFETIHPSRHNLYFWASDGIIPFDKNWQFIVKKQTD